MTTRHRLGDWTCPSGNNVIAFYRPVGEGQAVLDLKWDDPPPLLPDDERFYRIVIRPGVLAAVREYTEKTGAVLVVEL